LSWEAIIDPAPAAPANELAGQPIPPETEALVAELVHAATLQAAYRAPPAWRQRAGYILGEITERVGEVVGYPAWRVP
jgi:hypothetical protein